MADIKEPVSEIYNGKRLKVEKVLIDLPGGVKLERIVVKPGGAVAMLPVDDEYCYLIKQYRYAVDDYIYEAPAGTIEDGESPADTAKREIIEETGLSASEMIPKGYIFTSPGYTNEIIYLYEARGLAPSDEFEKDADEDITVVKVRISELRGMIEAERIVDAKTICLVYKCLGA
ncbi:NUDIX hydrolase [Methanoplanus limicola]|uniref:NUDIX hydrolase n=1 Tax=Methanoplanus limicola DSM 2279 TaxID=937775 RepID=H1YX27_9EURY|nr:NUDIX hydrolase [Methanoplanus limicola]EHQ34950.1 NUDIX hydrolase [Methanoplanus limicola DSM 2279]